MKTLRKEAVLPSKEEMRRDTEEDLLYRKQMGLSEKYAHKMIGKLFYQYTDKLAKMADIEPLSVVFRRLYADLSVMRKQDLAGYKNIDIEIVSNDVYVIKDRGHGSDQ